MTTIALNRSVQCACAAALALSSWTAVGSGAQDVAASNPPAKLALTGGRIIPVVGEEIDDGAIVIDRGTIVAIGSADEVEIPYDATEIDLSGKVLMPGMIDPHNWRGLDIANENLPVTPFLDVYDAIDPSRSAFEDALRDGATTVHVIAGNDTVIGGVSRAVRPVGMSVEEMTVAPDIALKISTSPKRGYDRMRQMATLRETFRELDHYLERLAERKYEQKLEREGEEITVGPSEARERGRELIKDSDYDDKHRNLVRLRRGELAGWIYAGAATDVNPAVQLAREQGFLDRAVFVLDGDAHLAVKELARTGRPVVLPSDLIYRDRDPATGEIEETFLPGVFHDAGVTFALQPNPGASMAERYLNYQAAMCVRNGIPRQEALEAITLEPAKMIGLEERLGSLEVGKTANIVVFSGDPLDFDSWVEFVFIDGVQMYDRREDPRLEKLLDLEARAEARMQQQAEEPGAAEEAAEEDQAADESDDGEGSEADHSRGQSGDDGDDRGEGAR